MEKHTCTTNIPKNTVEMYKGTTLVKVLQCKTAVEAHAEVEAWMQACPHRLLMQLIAVRQELRRELRVACPASEAFLREPLLVAAPTSLDPEKEALYMALSEAILKLA